jgi:hypothetical protein
VDGQTDLLVRNAKLVATCDDARRELPGVDGKLRAHAAAAVRIQGLDR